MSSAYGPINTVLCCSFYPNESINPKFKLDKVGSGRLKYLSVFKNI